MSNTFTTNLGLIQPGINDPSSTNLWGGFLNTDWGLVDTAIAGYLTKNVAGSANVILTSTAGQADESRNQNFQFIGTLTGNIIVFFPKSMTRSFSVFNNTAGAFSLTIAANNGSGAAGGTTVAVPHGATLELASDGVNIYQRNSAGAAASSGGTVGDSRNAAMLLTTAATSATFTADQIVIATALGGTAYTLTTYSQVINLATTGAGGMDTGLAPISGYVSLYAIYNPTSQTASILACVAATSTATIYAGANLPSGYTASALIGIWPTDGSRNFVIGQILGRHVSIVRSTAYGASSPTNWTAVSVSASVPPGAISVDGTAYSFVVNTGSGTFFYVAAYGTGTATGIGEVEFSGLAASSQISAPFYNLGLTTSQTIYYRTNGTAVCSIYISGYFF